MELEEWVEQERQELAAEMEERERIAEDIRKAEETGAPIKLPDGRQMVLKTVEIMGEEFTIKAVESEADYEARVRTEERLRRGPRHMNHLERKRLDASARYMAECACSHPALAERTHDQIPGAGQNSMISNLEIAGSNNTMGSILQDVMRQLQDRRDPGKAVQYEAHIEDEMLRRGML